MNQNTYAIAIIAIFGFTALSNYFEDRQDARERRERLVCIHEHGTWADTRANSWTPEFACIFPEHR